MDTIKEDMKCFGLPWWAVIRARIKVCFSRQARADKQFIKGLAQNFAKYILG